MYFIYEIALLLSLAHPGSSLNGTWIPVRQEIGGQALPEAALKGQQLMLEDSTYTMMAESVDKGIVKYHDNKIDIYGKDGVNKGKHFAAIYKYENDQLTICYNLQGDAYPDSFDTKSHPMFFLSVFSRSSK